MTGLGGSDQFATIVGAMTGLGSASTAPPAAGGVRAGDADRESAVERIRRAYVEARLTMAEFDTRTAAAWAATTRAELATLTADLPAVEPLTIAAPAAPPPRRSPTSAAGRTLEVLAVIWLTATLVNVAVWALVCIGGLQWIYPWWLWVAVPPGAALAVVSAYVRHRAGCAAGPRQRVSG